MAILQGARITGSIIATTFIKAAGFSGSLTASNLYVLGKAGIGTTSPASKLSIAGSSATNFKSLILRNGDGTVGSTVSIDLETSAGTIGDEASMAARISGIRLGSGTTGGLIFSTTNSGTLGERVRITNDGNVGIGTTSPGRKLHLYSTQSVIKLSNTGTGAWSGLEWSVGNGAYTAYSGLLDDTGRYFIDVGSNGDDFTILQNGNVGIGTSSPSNKLYVNGDGYFASTLYIADNTAVNFGNTSQIYHNSSRGSTQFTGTGGSDTICIKDSNGYVGIGTTSPLERITFGSSDSIIARSSDTTFNSGYCSRILFNQGGTGYGYLGFYTYEGGSGGGERMRIAENGNVGIGTTSPSQKLQVNGYQVYLYNDLDNNNTYFYARNSGPGNAGIKMKNSDGEWTIIANDRLRFIDDDAGVERLSILSNGNVGIGSTSPANKLEVDGGSSAVTLRVSTTNTGAGVASLILANSSKTAYNDGVKISHGAGYTNITDLNSTNIMTWDMSNTRVGIGTTSPVNKLHVSGSSTNLPLKLEGLTSNATGYFLTVDNTTGVVHKSTSGASGTSGTSGANGSPGTSGTSGTSGANGSPGTSGSSGSGSSGISGSSGTSGTTNIKAWVHFDGTGTPTINASLNVSSITDNNTGDYTINFTTAFANANYVVAGTATYEYENPGQSINNMFIAVPRRPTAQLAGSCRISTPGSDNALYDCKYVRVLFSN